MKNSPTRRIVRQHPPTGLHLGAEYNGNHGAAGPPMDELVSEYLRLGSIRDEMYFRFLLAQVRCFGEPSQFRYDDVSQVRAGGKHSSKDVYRERVGRSVTRLSSIIQERDPRLIIVAGTLAFDEFERQILPMIPKWRGDVIRARNPSAQAHWVDAGQSTGLWFQRYREFRSTLLVEPRPKSVRRWHLQARDADAPFQLKAL